MQQEDVPVGYIILLVHTIHRAVKLHFPACKAIKKVKWVCNCNGVYSDENYIICINNPEIFHLYIYHI